MGSALDQGPRCIQKLIRLPVKGGPHVGATVVVGIEAFGGPYNENLDGACSRFDGKSAATMLGNSSQRAQVSSLWVIYFHLFTFLHRHEMVIFSTILTYLI